MLSSPFLTALDSRAAIKGSRDPLGVQAIWSRLGRSVVGNLTTVSSLVRDFTVLLLGYYFAERLADEGGTESDVATFLKWEQLAAYARAKVNGESGFRGTERVKARIQEYDRVRLSLESDSQILGSQKTYGLWGLYSMPARASGLLEGDPTRLSQSARALVERVHLPLLEKAGIKGVRTIVDILRATKYDLQLDEGSKDYAVLEAVAKVIGKVRSGERDFYREHLLYGGRAEGDRERGMQGVQRAFAELLESTLDESGWRLTPRSLGSLANRAARMESASGSELALRLGRIRTCELLLAPVVAFFEHVLSNDKQTVGAVADKVRAQWGETLSSAIDLQATEAIRDQLGVWTDDTDSGARWLKIARAMQSARFEDAVLLVLEQNAAVMNARGAAAPWVRLWEGKLEVRFRDDHLARLPTASELAEYWRHAYFIESLRTVASALRGG